MNWYLFHGSWWWPIFGSYTSGGHRRCRHFSLGFRRLGGATTLLKYAGAGALASKLLLCLSGGRSRPSTHQFSIYFRCEGFCTDKFTPISSNSSFVFKSLGFSNIIFLRGFGFWLAVDFHNNTLSFINIKYIFMIHIFLPLISTKKSNVFVIFSAFG